MGQSVGSRLRWQSLPNLFGERGQRAEDRGLKTEDKGQRTKRNRKQQRLRYKTEGCVSPLELWPPRSVPLLAFSGSTRQDHLLLCIKTSTNQGTLQPSRQTRQTSAT